MIAPIVGGSAGAAGAAGAVGSGGKGFLKEAGSKVLDFLSSLGLGWFDRKWKREDYERQLADQERLIDEERAYNDFDSVMRRAAKAGVNPLHALGVGAVSGGNTTTSVPDIAPSNVNPLNVGGFLDAQMKIEQIKSAKLANQYSEQTLGYRTELAARLVESEKATIALRNAMAATEGLKQSEIQANIDYLNECERLQKNLADRQEQMTPLEVNKISAEIKKVLADAVNVTIRNEHEADLLVAQVNALIASASASYSQGRLARVQSAFVAQDSATRQKQVDAQEEFNRIYAECQQAEIDYKNDVLDFNKKQRWIDLVIKVVSVAAASGIGFAVGGPVGALVGAGVGVGVPVSGSMQPLIQQSMQPPRNPIGFGRAGN